MDSYGHETERGEGSGQKEKEIEKSPQKIPVTKSQKARKWKSQTKGTS